MGLVKIGFSDETIVNMIEHESGNYSLRADDVTALKKAGVSERAVAAMSSKMGIRPAPAPEVAAPVSGESAASTGQLTNDGIVKLAKAGLGEDTIVSMVNTQPGTYSVSADDIIALKKAGVPEKVIRAMLNKPVAPPTPPRETPTGAAGEQGQASQTTPMPSVPADTASSASSNARKPENVRYDKFKDVTTVQSRTQRWALGKLGILGGGALDFQYRCPGHTTNCQTGGVTVTFTRHGRGWILMYGLKEIIFLADGNRTAARDVTWDGLTTTDGVMEYFTGTLSPEDFHSITTGQDVEMEVGGSSGFTKRFKAKDIEVWREFGLSIGKTE
jgi:hypothetical protein